MAELGDGYSGWLVVDAKWDPAKAQPLTYELRQSLAGGGGRRLRGRMIDFCLVGVGFVGPVHPMP